MRVFIFIITFLSLAPQCSRAQSGFVVTVQDSIFHGYMKFVRQENGNNAVLITHDKKVTPRKYTLEDLKYYAYKKDTFAILRAFYPFEDEGYFVEVMEARVVIRRGALKLYAGTLPIVTDDKPIIIPIVTPAGISVLVYREPYSTFIVKNTKGELTAVRHDKDGFSESILGLVGSDKELSTQIKSGMLTFKDTRTIIQRYNERH